jgi:hypothetical protein
MNSRSGTFGIGVTFKGKDLAKQLRGNGPWSERWANVLEDFELQIQVGLVGTREETILAVTSYAPGFFQRRSLKELLNPKTQWVDLILDEHLSLAALAGVYL